jgi:hypothetical protein
MAGKPIFSRAKAAALSAAGPPSEKKKMPKVGTGIKKPSKFLSAFGKSDVTKY